MLERPKGDSFAEYRTWVLINVFMATGIRAKEMRELKIHNVDLANGILTLNHTKNRKARMVPIPTSLNVILNEYLRIRNGAGDEPLFCNIFGEPMERTTLQYAVKRYCERRGLKRCGLHLFRHTFITLSVRKGMSPILLKRITGHTNMKSLNNYYNFDVSDLVNIVDEYNPLEQFNAKNKMMKLK